MHPIEHATIKDITLPLFDAQTVDGVHYEFYADPHKQTKGGIIRTVDVDSGCVIQMIHYPAYPIAKRNYSEAVAVTLACDVRRGCVS